MFKSHILKKTALSTGEDSLLQFLRYKRENTAGKEAKKTELLKIWKEKNKTIAEQCKENTMVEKIIRQKIHALRAEVPKEIAPVEEIYAYGMGNGKNGKGIISGGQKEPLKKLGG